MTQQNQLSAKYVRLTEALRRAEAKKGATDLIERLDRRITAVWMVINNLN